MIDGSCDDIDDEFEDDELSDGTELCPICQRKNEPGADDVCQHYVGSTWDGDIIWSDVYDEWQRDWQNAAALWGEISDSRDEWPEERQDALLGELTRVGGRLDIEIYLNEGITSAANAFLMIAHFESGPTVETSGMIGGSGYSLYLEDPGDVERSRTTLREIVGVLRSFQSNAGNSTPSGPES